MFHPLPGIFHSLFNIFFRNSAPASDAVFQYFQVWNSNEVLHFNVNISDTTTSHNVYIAVRNTGEYAYSNLYLFVTAHSPNGTRMLDTLEITLADERGKWLGKGSASVFTLYYSYRYNIRFPIRGIYQFDLEQAMWIKDMKHISHVGMRIEKTGK